MATTTITSPETPPNAGYAQPIMAGVLAALVGYASTFALVLAGLTAVGASAAEAASGLFATTLAVAILNFVVALRLRVPLSFAWSTPGAAFLLTIGEPPGGFPAVAGAFLMTAALIVLAGLWKPVARAVAAIPGDIASAMLAGILFSLCLAPLRAVAEMPMLAAPVILVWALALRFARRYAVPLAVMAAAIALWTSVDLPSGAFDSAWPGLVPVFPVFTLDGLIRIAIPLFVITMASQNLPGLAVMQANGFPTRPAPAFISTGVATAGTAAFGGITINLAAITAALAAGPESHPDPRRRWPAPVAAGITYLLLALAAGIAAAFIVAAPPLLIEAVAGLALMTSLAAALGGALDKDGDRLPAVVTFVTAASGITVLGIGAAFWAVVAGIALKLMLRARA